MKNKKTCHLKKLKTLPRFQVGDPTSLPKTLTKKMILPRVATSMCCSTPPTAQRRAALPLLNRGHGTGVTVVGAGGHLRSWPRCFYCDPKLCRAVFHLAIPTSCNGTIRYVLSEAKYSKHSAGAILPRAAPNNLLKSYRP